MLLKEMFSPIGAANEEAEIDWLGDLKQYIDDHDHLLSGHMFPAIKKHQGFIGHPGAYKLYIKPIEQCKEEYCNKFEIDEPGEVFPKEKIIELAKQCCAEQERHIKDGHYDN